MFGNLTTNAQPSQPQRKMWWLIAGIGMVAVTAGMVLPQSFQSGAPLAPPASTPATATQPNSPIVGDKGKREGPARTAGDLTYAPPSWPEAPDSRSMLLRLGLGTVVVLGLCVGTLWAAKRWMGITPAGGAPGGQLRLVDTLSLGGRCNLYLVSAADRSLLVGVDATGLKTVVALPEGFADTLADVKQIAESSSVAEAPAKG